MKSIFALIVLLLSTCFAQAQSPKCIGHIITKIEELGTDKISFKEINNIAKDHSFIREGFVGNAAKEQATARMFESLSEFITLAPNISAEGMKGYTRFTGLIVRLTENGINHTDQGIKHLKEAFTASGKFDGASFDKVMAQLADESKFIFDAGDKSFTFKKSGLKMRQEEYGKRNPRKGGEKNTINHIFRGHTKNDNSDIEFQENRSSIFSNTSEILNLIDDAWNKPTGAKTAHPTIPNTWVIDLFPKIVGKVSGSGNLTSKIAISVENPNILRTAFPIQ